MKRIIVLACVIVLAIVVSILSMLLPRTALPTERVEVSNAILIVELLIVLVGGIAALAYLVPHRWQAPAIAAIGVYMLVSGAAFIVFAEHYLMQDDLGALLFVTSGLACLVGLVLLIPSVIMVSLNHQWGEIPRTVGLTIAGAVLTTAILLIRGPDDWSSYIGANSLHLYGLPLFVMGLAIGLSIPILTARSHAADPRKASGAS